MNLRLASILSFFTLALTLIVGLGMDTRQSVAAPAGTTDQLTYLPFVAKAPDLFITNLEISQSVQDANNTVPLVANRPTVVRVYTATSSGNSVPNTSITLTATRNGVALTPVTSGVKTASGASSRSSLSSTYNVTLPADWLSGTVLITAKVTGEPIGSFTKLVTFNTVPTLNVVLVPINYTHTPTGVTFPGPNSDGISDWIMRAYPLSNMNVTLHPNGMNFSGNLREAASWEQLLNDVSQLKDNDIDFYSPTVYYAYIDFDCGWFNCSTGGIAGIGWIGFRAAVGFDHPSTEVTGELAGHEIGHNFGRYHAPCGVSGDANYPYTGASIGQYGLDGIGGSLELLSPNDYVDMMSYCDPVWVSDYTYEALYTDQVNNGALVWAPAEESLVVRGSVAEDGAVSLNPVYILPQTAVNPQNGLYEVELLDTAGNIIATHSLDLLIAEEEGVSAQAIHGVVPAPEVPVAELRIVEVASGTAVANRTLSTASMAANATLNQRSETATVSWGIADVPANVRYTVGNGQTWTTVGLNVLGGSLDVDLSNLPGGGNGRFQIILADQGTPTRFEVALPTPLADKQPTAWITGPNVVSTGAPAELYAFGSDAEDGALRDFAWSVDGEAVDADSALFLHELAPGEHVITLRATTSSGQTAVTSKVITVAP
ncbi:MAG: hypothetical protein CL608_05080 [Anaerolineaceae bacterium]|nr:hypothetical protein [Anaerolineaceae bacterium]